MSIKRVALLIVAVGLVVLAVGAGPRMADIVRALSPAEELAPGGVTIAYPGRLSGEAGQAAIFADFALPFHLFSATILVREIAGYLV